MRAMQENYYIVFPNDERIAGRNFRTGPFHEELVRAGCVFQERQGWERPGWFCKEGPVPVPKYDWFGAYGHPHNTDHRYEEQLKKDHTFVQEQSLQIGEECLACREQVSVFDLSSIGKYYLCGPDAQKAANWLFTADTNRQLGKTVYTCMLNARAGIEGDVTSNVIEPGGGGLIDPIFKDRGFYITSLGASPYTHIQSVINQKKFNVEFIDVSDKIGLLSIQGPNSEAILRDVVDTNLHNEAFPYSTSKLIKVAGHMCRVVRISYVGELGWEIHIPRDSCSSVYRAIWQQGSKHGLQHAGFRALQSLSCEKGNNLWNFDLQISDNPLEAGLSFLCRESGDYLGKEALDIIKHKGLSKKLVYFQLKEEIPLWGLEAIVRDDQVVGYLRRGEYSYSFGLPIGLGYVKHPEGRRISSSFLSEGHYQIEVMAKRYDATMCINSPFDPNGKRMLGIYDEPLPVRQ
ncbi:hypothetical protein L9F63_006663 [Diploptera punctata]|uniref:Sarcosine dehydrogenase n=1 Tax=Diploptera punctata TaxID=6984 RepID=A0AAD7Z9T8_DIPPU|nr:hypothetical protein L9F63_006663 [Diploptera punctata]